MKNGILDPYEALQRSISQRGLGPHCHESLIKCIKNAYEWLQKRRTVDLISKVPGKKYFAFAKLTKRSRAVNKWLYSLKWSPVESTIRSLLAGTRRGINEELITRSMYTAAIAFCAAVDLIKERDQKTPGTFFEYLCALVFQGCIGVAPKTKLDVLNLELRAELPTDFIFELGPDRPRFHMPVKTSTRERVIQVWAHQRVLDGVYGVGRFLGVPIILAETKVDTRTREVVEICLPLQWRLYQMHISQLWRVVYLDLPTAYANLNKVFPPVGVTTAGGFFVLGGHLDKAGRIGVRTSREKGESQ